jgi:hypothetical protein
MNHPRSSKSRKPVKTIGLLKRAGTLSLSADSNQDVSADSSRSEYGGYCCFSLKSQDDLRKELGPNAEIDEIASKIEHRWSNELTQQERDNWDKLSKLGSTVGPKEKSKKTTSCKRGEEELTISKNMTKVKALSKETPRKNIPKRNEDNQKPSSDEGSKPKRPMTAYLFFAQEIRPKIKERHPDLRGNAVTKLIGKTWSTLNELERIKYKQQERNARVAYKMEMRTWISECETASRLSSTMSQASMPTLALSSTGSIDEASMPTF